MCITCRLSYPQHARLGECRPQGVGNRPLRSPVLTVSLISIRHGGRMGKPRM
nr:MAG TPA: hypothetical protein [Caudoviricetes sp.]